MQEEKQVATIRRFNRYYTNVLGLLDQHILESDLSLSEVRVMHEINKMINCTSKILSDILCMDAGYLSRILKKLQKMNFIVKREVYKSKILIYNGVQQKYNKKDRGCGI